MDFFIQEIKKALDVKCFYAAFHLAITLPAMCAAAENPHVKKGKDREKYTNWCSKNFPNANAELLYRLRCGMVHEGSLFKDKKEKYDRVLLTTEGNLIVHNCVIQYNNESCYVINIPIFCKEIIEAVKRWIDNTKNDVNIARNIDKMAKMYSLGVSPYIVGVPVVA